jgi:hypothetical protein
VPRPKKVVKDPVKKEPKVRKPRVKKEPGPKKVKSGHVTYVRVK